MGEVGEGGVEEVGGGGGGGGVRAICVCGVWAMRVLMQRLAFGMW